MTFPNIRFFGPDEISRNIKQETTIDRLIDLIFTSTKMDAADDDDNIGWYKIVLHFQIDAQKSENNRKSYE